MHKTMENSIPLLDSVDSETLINPSPLYSPSSIDDLIEFHLKNFSYMQFIQALLLSVPMFYDCQQTFISVFTDAGPNCDSSGFCYKTIISEWGLESASSAIVGLPSSSFFIGSLLGGFTLSTLGDSILGRKNLLIFSCFFMCLFSFFTAFSTNIWIYTILRFLTGFARAPVMTSAIVLLMEIAGKKWRGLMVIIGFLIFSIGTVSLAVIAYTLRFSSWKYIYFWTSIPAMIYCLIVYFIAIESPRWLFLHGYEAKALEVLCKLSSIRQNICLPSSLLYSLQKEKEKDTNMYSSMKMLYTSRWTFKNLLWVTTLAFGIGMAYFGILLGVENLNFNLYFSMAFNGVSDLPAYFVTLVALEKWNRKSSILGFCMLSGLSCILCVLTNGKELSSLQIGFELIALLSVCSAYNVVLFYTAELFPTSVRNSATAMVRQAINFGAVFSPILISYGRKSKFLSYGVFGLFVIFSGLFVFCLPETKGIAICDTLDEQEAKEFTVEK